MKRLLLAVFAAAFVLCVALCAQTCPQGFTLLGNICVLNSSSAGSSGAVQASNGTGGFADTGCTGSAASITCSAGFKGGASFSASGGETATPSAPSSDTLFFSSTAHLPQFTKAGDSTVDGTQVVPASGATSNQWVTYIDTLGVMHYAQPAFSNLSGSPTATQIGGAGTLTNATSGNAATATALAATPAACGSNQYATGIAASGNASCAQVGYSQVSGTPTGGGIIENAGDNSAILAGASYSWIAGTSTHVSAPGLIPTACTATNLVVYFSAAISAGGSIVTSLYDVTAGSATALSVTAAASAAAGFYSDTTDTVTINPSHLYSMQTVNNASSSQTFAPYLWAFQCK
jgi:hypothetical protein